MTLTESQRHRENQTFLIRLCVSVRKENQIIKTAKKSLIFTIVSRLVIFRVSRIFALEKFLIELHVFHSFMVK